MAAGGVTEAVSIQEMEQQILKQIPKLQLKIGETAKIIVILSYMYLSNVLYLVQIPFRRLRYGFCLYFKLHSTESSANMIWQIL